MRFYSFSIATGGSSVFILREKRQDCLGIFKAFGPRSSKFIFDVGCKVSLQLEHWFIYSVKCTSVACTFASSFAVDFQQCDAFVCMLLKFLISI